MRSRPDRRSQIIDAAVKVFARKGFYNATIANVAREAGVADGTIYLYFKSKDDLLISLFETRMEAILERFSAVLNENIPAAAKLEHFIRLHFHMIEEDQNLAEVFQVELRQSSKFLKDYHNQKFIDFLNLIGRILSEGQKNHEFDPDISVNQAKISIFGALDELARQWILSDEPKYHLKDSAGSLAKLFLRGLTVNSQET